MRDIRFFSISVNVKKAQGQRIENPRVLGSIPRLATKTSKATFGWLLFLRCLKNPCQFIVAAYMNGNATTDKKPERRCECGSFPCVAVRRFDIEYDFVTVIQCADDDMRFVGPDFRRHRPVKFLSA